MSGADLFAGLAPPADRRGGAPLAHPCAVCGARLAPFGFGLRCVGGAISAVWTCRDHRAEGEAMAPASGREG